MAELHYRDAWKLGHRAYRACVSAGQYPYLPALDDIIASERSVAGSDLGIVSIPAKFIVGTKTRGRVNAFANNFMPLLAENTEFAQKWERLCQSHLEEGIRDPIKVYEYLNRYYVQEGNKRVSVLKFFDAVFIPAQVIRVMPESGDSEEVQRYLEYLDFNRLSGLNYVELTRRGGYARLQALVGKAPNETWTADDRAEFSTAYYAFEQAYAAAGGTRLTASTADAMLAFMEICGYDILREGGDTAIKKAVARMWEEVRLQQEASPIDLKAEPTDERRPSLLAKVISPVRTIRAAFIYDRNPDNSAWAYGHERGRRYVQELLDGKVETTAWCDAMVKGDQETIERAIEAGNTVLFTTSPRLLPASLQAAVAHPDVTFFNCALNQSHRYIRTYYPRIYEAKFIVGAIAGALAEGGDVGYICDYPIYGQIAGVNAFALGVQLVNPRAKVRLAWSSVAGPDAARRELVERGVRLISSQDLSRKSDGSFGAYGLIEAGEHAARLLAAPLWKWNVYYEAILRRLLDGTLREEYESSTRALNYYWGMAAGVVDVQLSRDLPEGVKKLASWLKEGLCREFINPFGLPIRGQDGAPVQAEGTALGLEQIMAMDYLVENVAGSIPAYDELKPFSKATVDVMGVDRSTKERS